MDVTKLWAKTYKLVADNHAKKGK